LKWDFHRKTVSGRRRSTGRPKIQLIVSENILFLRFNIIIVFCGLRNHYLQNITLLLLRIFAVDSAAAIRKAATKLAKSSLAMGKVVHFPLGAAAAATTVSCHIAKLWQTAKELSTKALWKSFFQ